MLRLRLAGRPGPSAPFRAASRAPTYQRGVQELFDVGAKPAEWNQAGRSWRASELRIKSFDDLHKLWYVLLKEKNLLVSQRDMMDENGQKAFKRKNSRLWKVKKSMARLLTVLSERKNVHEEYKRSMKRASKTPDSELPSVESLQGKTPAADAKPAADVKSAAPVDAKPEEIVVAVPKGAEGVTKLLADAGVAGGPNSKGRKKAAALKKAKVPEGEAGTASASEPKKEKVRRDWRAIRAQWKAAKGPAGAQQPSAAAADAAPPAAPDAPADAK